MGGIGDNRRDHIFGFSISTIITFVSQIIIIAGAFYGLKYGIKEESIYRQSMDEKLAITQDKQMEILMSGKKERLEFQEKIVDKLDEMSKLYQTLMMRLSELKTNLEFKAVDLDRSSKSIAEVNSNYIKNNERAICGLEKRIDSHEERLNSLSQFQKTSEFWKEQIENKKGK